MNANKNKEETLRKLEWWSRAGKAVLIAGPAFSALALVCLVGYGSVDAASRRGVAYAILGAVATLIVLAVVMYPLCTRRAAAYWREYVERIVRGVYTVGRSEEIPAVRTDVPTFDRFLTLLLEKKPSFLLYEDGCLSFPYMDVGQEIRRSLCAYRIVPVAADRPILEDAVLRLCLAYADPPENDRPRLLKFPCVVLLSVSPNGVK